MAKYLGIVPARAGSVDVPGKNLRLVAGRPIVWWAIQRLSADPRVRVVVTTDDLRVVAISQIAGVEVIWRDPHLCDATTPLEDVVLDVVTRLQWTGPVVMTQPTAATLSTMTTQDALDAFEAHEEWDSLVTVVADPHHGWHENHGKVEPLFDNVVNRQLLGGDQMVWKNTGGLAISRCVPNVQTIMTGSTHHLYEVPTWEAVDIDTHSDLAAARQIASAGTVEFRIAGGKEIGLGHIYRALAIADEIAHHNVRFVVAGPEWVIDLVREKYPTSPSWRSAADVVVFDCLDSTEEEVITARQAGARVICIEDRGPGGICADLLVNDLYDQRDASWIVLRSEFACVPPKRSGQRVLVMFGGTDAAGRTEHVARLCASSGLEVHVMCGPGVPQEMVDAMSEFTSGMGAAEAIADAAVVITSCGRTVHEAIIYGRPVVAIPANAREMDHVRYPMVAYLDDPEDDQILEAVLSQLERTDDLLVQGRLIIDGKGVRRYAHVIDAWIEGL